MLFEWFFWLIGMLVMLRVIYWCYIFRKNFINVNGDKNVLFVYIVIVWDVFFFSGERLKGLVYGW